MFTLFALFANTTSISPTHTKFSSMSAYSTITTQTNLVVLAVCLLASTTHKQLVNCSWSVALRLTRLEASLAMKNWSSSLVDERTTIRNAMTLVFVGKLNNTPPKAARARQSSLGTLIQTAGNQKSSVLGELHCFWAPFNKKWVRVSRFMIVNNANVVPPHMRGSFAQLGKSFIGFLLNLSK